MADGLLPERARRILADAWAESSTLDELARRKIVDAAHDRVKREFPQYFKEESNGGNPGGGE